MLVCIKKKERHQHHHYLVIAQRGSLALADVDFDLFKTVSEKKLNLYMLVPTACGGKIYRLYGLQT